MVWLDGHFMLIACNETCFWKIYPWNLLRDVCTDSEWHIKHSSFHREDCVFILNKCVDPESLPFGQTVQVLCNSLSPDDSHGSCISIKKYTSKSRFCLACFHWMNWLNPMQLWSHFFWRQLPTPQRSIVLQDGTL